MDIEMRMSTRRHPMHLILSLYSGIWYNEPLFNDVLGITNDFLYPWDDKICEKEPRDNETSLYRTNFANPLAPRYTEVPMYKETPRRNF